MIVSWLVYGLLVSTLLGVAAWLGEAASRGQGWSGRGAWAAALGGSVAFPAWAWLAPSAETTAGPGPLPGAYVMEALPPLVLQPSSSTGPSLEGLVALGWGATTALLLFWLAVSVARLWAARRGWDATEVDGVPVLVSESTGPAAMGLLRGRVVVPRWALELDAGLRRLMVLHEAEHVRARDPQLAVAGLLVCTLMPWNVAAWWQLRRLRLAIEMDCDARVLRRSGDVRRYGELLLEVGQRRRARLAVGLSETRTSLERRIRMMTRSATGRRTIRGLGLGALSVLALAVACETPGPTEVAEPERRPVELDKVRVQMNETPHFGTDCDPLFYLNADRFTAPLSDLDPDRIAEIQVFKGAAAERVGACGVVLMITKDATREERTAVELLLRRLRPAPAAATTESLAAGPTFTPMTQRPQLRNATDVRRQLLEQYPPLLRDAGIGGTANVWFLIAEDGAVARTLINTGSGYDALDEAALRVAETMEFAPAQLEGKAVPVWVALDITFESEGREPKRTDIVDDVPAAARTGLQASLRQGQRPKTGALGDAPTFTPMTVRPQLKNAAEVRENLMRYYPPLLRDAGIGGTANVWFFIESDGAVGRVSINRTSGHAALDDAALRVAETMEFTPARNQDEVVPVWVALDITFDLDP